MNTDYMSKPTETEHDLTLAIPGDVDSINLRLINAIQKLGYKILSEQPLQAKRRLGSCRDCSLHALDYPTKLTVSLKQTNNVAVLATFSYEVKSYVPMTKGDRQTLAREAEALVALGTERLAITACRGCGTQITDESHFCRRCGAPLVLDLPELEVLRITRGARGSYHNIFVGLIALLLAALTVIPVFVVNGARIFGPLLWVGIPLACYALFLLTQGLWRLHWTLNPKAANNSSSLAQVRATTSVTTALPAAPVGSIAEGTTELLLSVPERQVAEPVRKDTNTAELDTDRFM